MMNQTNSILKYFKIDLNLTYGIYYLKYAFNYIFMDLLDGQVYTLYFTYKIVVWLLKC